VIFDDAGLTGRVLDAGETAGVEGANEPGPLQVEFSAAAGVSPGWHNFSLVTPTGLTNEGSVMIVDSPVIEDADREHPASSFPLVINGRIKEPGAAASYWIAVEASERLTLEVTSGNTRFDPVLTLYEPSGSWFDPHRLNRIAFNDEPLYFPGLSADSRVVWRFARTGTYCIQVKGFAGQGGPDAVYLLSIARGAVSAPLLHPKIESPREERQFVRTLGTDWLEKLAVRGGLDVRPAPPEIFRAAAEETNQIPLMKLPAMIEGRFTRPAEAHRIRMRIDRPEHLALEVETPEATRPRFNPVVRLLDSRGAEVVTNVYNRVNNNSLQVMKMLEPKTVFGILAPGEYTLQVHDIGTDSASDDFAYRILVRRQIAHVGNVDVRPDRVNLAPGGSKPLTISIEREEGFAATVTVSVKGLPDGVVGVPAMVEPDDPPRLENAGKREPYFPQRQSMTVMLVARSDAAVAHVPVRARVEIAVRGANGAPRPPIAVKEIRVMVVRGGA
jgi:hypothetical protein